MLWCLFKIVQHDNPESEFNLFRALYNLDPACYVCTLYKTSSYKNIFVL